MDEANSAFQFIRSSCAIFGFVVGTTETKMQNLVWDGRGIFKEESAIYAYPSSRQHVHNLHLIEYHGAPHLACSTQELDPERAEHWR